jgi:hypothetical protein
MPSSINQQPGIVFGSLTPYYPFPTSIRGFANQGGAPDAWIGGRLRSANWKRP